MFSPLFQNKAYDNLIEFEGTMFKVVNEQVWERSCGVSPLFHHSAPPRTCQLLVMFFLGPTCAKHLCIARSKF